MKRGIGDLLFQTTPNEDMKTAAKLTKDLLRNAKNEVKIVSGTLTHDFYIDYKIDEVLEEISDKIDIQIISGKDYDKESKSILNLAKNQKIKLYLYNGEPPKHFLLIDSKNVRAEISHTVKDLNLSKTKGNVIKNSIFLGNKLKLDFKKFKRDSKAYT